MEIQKQITALLYQHGNLIQLCSQAILPEPSNRGGKKTHWTIALSGLCKNKSSSFTTLIIIIVIIKWKNLWSIEDNKIKGMILKSDKECKLNDF